ncbi:unnamed protein product [Nyctereutes procyonoides]|uniref:(raccoon dog) hypothetical protein n=1 Tax=Nyctereutes procyonoides TaxID=34880 RepID=A0A811XY81_NYCPR|nr:unnamed protein product [Nyctereutes procyonoides]
MGSCDMGLENLKSRGSPAPANPQMAGVPAGSGGAALGVHGQRLGLALLAGMISFTAWTFLAHPLRRQQGGPFVGGVTVAGGKLVAGCLWAFHSPCMPGSTGHCCPALGVTPPCPALPPTAGVLEKPRLPGEGGGGAALPSGHRATQGVPDCSWPPAPSPFFPLLFVQDLLIWEQGRFMWHWASPGLPAPPMAGDFLFIWRWEPGASEQDGRRDLVVSQNLGDSAFSGVLWPCSFDILSGSHNKGEARGSGKVMLLARALNGEGFSGTAAERRPLSQEDYCLSVGGLACDPGLLRMTLSTAAVSGFGGVGCRHIPPTPQQLAPYLPSVLELPTGVQPQATLARSFEAQRHLEASSPGGGSLEAGQPDGLRLQVHAGQRMQLFPFLPCVPVGSTGLTHFYFYEDKWDLKPMIKILCACFWSVG